MWFEVLLCLFISDAGTFGKARILFPIESSESLCNSELGMQANWIQDAAITASSIRDLEHDPGRARLHGNGAWRPLIQSADQFLQIHFDDETNVSAVAIQGHPENEFWVSKYSLSFSMDAKRWEDHSEVFDGSKNKHEITTSQLEEPKMARFLRVKPIEWHGDIALRVEIYGCMRDFPKCGIRRQEENRHSRQRRIVGGSEARPNSWPWQVEILVNGTSHWCGGSLIHPQWIITAAHCVDKFYSPYPREIRLGEHHSKTLEGYEEVVEADKSYMHPGFTHDRPTFISAGDYDFALYHLKRPATFYSRVSPVCLPDEDSTIAEDVGRVCVVTGWGHTSENGNFSDVLHENEVPIVSWEECNKERSYNGYIKERFMCAGYEEGGKDACQGDSGGPLVCQDDAGRWVLAGVVTWGVGCARPLKFGVYSDVRRFLPFIESTIYGYPECGVRPVASISSRIVGGREARPNSWPWQVDLLVNGTAHYCGGSLIDPSWIVTSAHCFYLYTQPEQWQVRVGEHNETKFEGYEEMINIDTITIHPGFILGSAEDTGDYDIAIIKLKRPAVFHKLVHSICLPEMETRFATGKTCFATGWGKQDENAAEYSDVLREVEVDLVSKEVCNSNISYNGLLNERYFCAGFQAGDKDACSGDSGGPLACQIENGSFVLTGVVSWGEGCARANKYGVYLDVRFMLPFIESTIDGYPKCGTRFLTAQSSLAVNGSEARPNSWPWQVELLFNDTHACSGSLIDQRWIVTSTACVNSSHNPENWNARLGEHNRTVLEGYEETIKIDNILTSPLGHITLMKMKRVAVLHQRVTPVCLPEENTTFPVGSSCYVSGWRSKKKEGNPTVVLNEAQVELASSELCNTSYGGMVTKYEHCASTLPGKDEVCNVENGTPLVCPGRNGTFVLAGVASSEDWCSNPGQYGVFIDVKMMLSFIESTIAPKKEAISV